MLKKILIAIFILVNISSKTIPTLEFAKETDFNEEISEFSVEYEGEETSLLVYLTQKNNNINLVLSEKEGELSGESYNFKYPGGGAVYSLSKDKSNFLNIFTKDEKIETGKIWANPLNNEIDIDLSKTYEQNFYIRSNNLYLKGKMLNYTVSNLDSDKTFTFYYNFSELFLINPFNICHIEEGKEDCQDYVAKYTFKKNEKYKICLKFEEVTFEETKYYYLPQYQFHKGTELKFGVETNFDKDHNAFIVEDLGLKEDDMVGVLIYIYQQNKESDFIINKLSPYSGMEDLFLISNPGEGIVYWAFDEDEFVLFIKGIEEEEKGTIWFNPLNREIEIDLSKKYEGKLPVKNDLGEDFTQPLTYSVSNLKEDKTFIFEY